MPREDSVMHPNERPVRRRPADERSFGELLGELTRETRTLVRQEINLAKTEASEKASAAGKDVAYVAAGGAVAYAGLIAVVFAFVFLVAGIMPVWLSSLTVGLVVAGIGYALAQRGLTALKRMNLTLSRTTETLQEDKQWMKDEMSGERPARGTPRTTR